jgi:DNA-binding transcriptional LysR family regulator
MVDLRHIETFFWVAQLGSFRAASEKLHTTQPAISQRIAALEEGLGVRLFERDSRGVTLTAKGQELLSHAERMLQMRQDMMQAAREQNVMSGPIRIGVAETIVQTWLPNFLEHLHTAYPALVPQIEVDTSYVMRSQLLARQIDLAFMLGPVEEARLENLHLCAYPLAWVASPRLEQGAGPLKLTQVARFPIITYPSNSAPYKAVQDMMARAKIKAPRMIGSASLSMVVKMMLDCVGVGVIAPIFLDKELANGELRILDVRVGDLPDLVFTATWVQGPESRTLKAIAQLAQRTASEYERRGKPLRKRGGA